MEEGIFDSPQAFSLVINNTQWGIIHTDLELYIE